MKCSECGRHRNPQSGSAFNMLASSSLSDAIRHSELARELEAACSRRVACPGAVPAAGPSEEVLWELTEQAIQVICAGTQTGEHQ